MASPEIFGHLRSCILIEVEITWRMLADNTLASFAPGLVLVSGLCLREELDPMQVARLLTKSCVLSALYTYVFDAVNQAQGALGDGINEPWRPIPRGLLTPAGAMHRFWCAMALYAATGWSFGVFESVLLWQAATVIINIWCAPSQYFWCKSMCMALGIASQLSQAWRLVTPIEDSTARRWISFMVIAYVPPLIFEDVRDVPGDKAIGRRTFAIMLGEFPVRTWFATVLTVMPLLAHIFLFSPESISAVRLVVCDIAVAASCWIAAGRSLTLRSIQADRVTYQLYIFTCIVVPGCGCILWA